MSIREQDMYPLLRAAVKRIKELEDNLAELQTHPEEEKYAYWKTREEHHDYLWVECSNCGFMVENYKAVKTGRSSIDIIGNKWNGCPICLAKMGGGNK